MNCADPRRVWLVSCCKRESDRYYEFAGGCQVDEEMLLQSSELELNGEVFSIKVFCSSAGRFFAKTCLGEGDFIITDGPSLPEALKKHEDLLPLAVGTRELTQSYLGYPRKPKMRRP
jgi:hypothetical protein